MKRAVFIIGPHRSGTSALAGYLHYAGIKVRGPKHGGDWKNKRGYFEDVNVLDINQCILGKDNIELPEEDVSKIDIDPFCKQKIDNICKKYAGIHPSWLWKDPRLCYTFKLWIEGLTKYIMPDEILCLFLFRSQMPTIESWANVFKWDAKKCNDCINKYKIYMREGMDFCNDNGIPYEGIDFESLIDNPLNRLLYIESAYGEKLKHNGFILNKLVHYK